MCKISLRNFCFCFTETGTRIVEFHQYESCLLCHQLHLGHCRVNLGPADISCQCTGTVCAAHLDMWHLCRAVHSLMNRQQSFLCHRTTSVEQAADRAEAAAVNLESRSTARTTNSVAALPGPSPPRTGPPTPRHHASCCNLRQRRRPTVQRRRPYTATCMTTHTTAVTDHPRFTAPVAVSYGCFSQSREMNFSNSVSCQS